MLAFQARGAGFNSRRDYQVLRAISRTKVTTVRQPSVGLGVKDPPLYCGGGAIVAYRPHKPETSCKSSDRNQRRVTAILYLG